MLQISGSVTLDGALVERLDSTGAGVGINDLLAVGSTLDITGGSLELQALTPLGDPAYVLATYGALVGGQFDSIAGLPDGYHVDYHYGGSNEIAIVAPEPSTLALLAVGGLYDLACACRRKRRA